MPRVNFVKRAQKPNSVVTQKDIDAAKAAAKKLKRKDLSDDERERLETEATRASYFHWAFRFGPKLVSKTRPRQSQLTQSEYLGQFYSLEEQAEDIGDIGSKAEIEAAADTLETIKDEIETLGEEQESKRDNMPEALQDSETGELLQQRADACEELSSALDTAIDELRELAESLPDSDDDELEEGECDLCSRSGVQIARTDDDGLNICVDCDDEGDEDPAVNEACEKANDILSNIDWTAE